MTDLAAIGLDGLHLRLAHVITEFDRRQATRRGYNPNALGIMLGALDETFEDVASGKRGSISDHLRNHFNDQILDNLLASVHEYRSCPDCKCLKKAHHGPKIGCEGLGGNCPCERVFSMREF